MPTVTRLMKPCVGYYDRERHARVECGRLCARSRCDEHERMYQATRRPPAPERGYDAQYRRDRARLLAPDPVTGELPACQLRLDGCTGLATTADHDDPLLGGRNLAARRGHLTPACASCNSKRGARPVLTVASPPGSPLGSTRGEAEMSARVRADDDVQGPAPEAGPTIMPDGSVR